MMLVNGEYVDDELIRIEAASLREHVRNQMPGANDLEIAMQARSWARENVIERVLLHAAARQKPALIPVQQIEDALQNYYAQDAKHASCMLPRDHEALRASIELDLRLERLTADLTAKTARPSAREVKKYYNENKQLFSRPELVHAAHIVKNVDETVSEDQALAAITSVKASLIGGSNFEQLADEFSDCPGRGGDLGSFARGEMVEEFDAVVFGLAPGQTSDIFRSPFGFHIAKVYERNRARLLSLDELQGEIENLLWGEKRRAVIRSYVAELRTHADIRKSAPVKAFTAT